MRTSSAAQHAAKIGARGAVYAEASTAQRTMLATLHRTVLTVFSTAVTRGYSCCHTRWFSVRRA